tara:strand:+ start:316 stop:543 length:228 start_codon:yes stop_codon:yes gene_type:complete
MLRFDTLIFLEAGVYKDNSTRKGGTAARLPINLSQPAGVVVVVTLRATAVVVFRVQTFHNKFGEDFLTKLTNCDL